MKLSKLEMRQLKQLRLFLGMSEDGEPMRPMDEIDLDTAPYVPRGMTRAWKNDRYTVQEYKYETTWGLVSDVMIQRLDGTAGSNWRDFQQIKHELYPDQVAVEVYPVQSEVVDDCNIYHLWVLPTGFDLPFGIHRGSNGAKRLERTA